MAAQSAQPRREENSTTTKDPLAGQWEDLRGQLRAWWDRLTEADLVQIGGQKDRLISLVQQRYGYTRERAQQEVDRRLQEYGDKPAGVAATVTSAAQDVTSRITQTAGEVSTTVQETAATAASAVSETVKGASGYLQEKGMGQITADLAGVIRRYPIPALLIGLGIGFVLGRSLGKAAPTPGA